MNQNNLLREKKKKLIYCSNYTYCTLYPTFVPVLYTVQYSKPVLVYFIFNSEVVAGSRRWGLFSHPVVSAPPGHTGAGSGCRFPFARHAKE